MKRTNIYLEEAQSAAVARAARARGITRAEYVRRLIDRSVGAAGSDLDADLAAIEGCFAVLAAGDEVVRRGVDARARHLARVERG